MADRPSLMARRPWLPLLVTVGLMIGLGGWVAWQWLATRQAADLEQERLFQIEVDYIEHGLRERMQAYAMVLRGLSGLIGLTNQVSPDEWHQATDRLMLLETYPGIQAVNFARHVTDAELPLLIDYLQDYRPDFHVWPETGKDEHVVVKYTHPMFWRNRQVLGYDLLSEPTRRLALVHARDTGNPTLTGPLRLLQETTESAQAGVLLFLPIYRTGVPLATLAERREAFHGTLYGAFRLNDLVQGVLSERLEQFDIQLFDAAEPGMPLLQGAEPRPDAGYFADRAIELYGRNWRLQVTSTPEYDLMQEAEDGAFSLVAGLAAAVLFSLLVGGYFLWRERAMAVTRAQSLELREREERFRLLIERLPVATLLASRTGQIELANQSAAALLGGTVEEVLGHRVSYYLPGAMSGRETLQTDLEVQVHHTNGEKVPVTLHVTPLSHLDTLHYLFNLIDLRAFKRAEERFRDVVEGLPNAFLLINDQGRIVMVNRQTETLLGYSREELLGEPIEKLVPEAQRAGHVALRDGFLSRPEPWRLGSNREVFGQHRDGRHIPLEIGLAPLRSGDELLVQAVLIDISHRKAAELRLRDQADQLAVANRYKSEFLANMSHELRTPLNSILILSDQLRHNAAGNLSPKQVRHADVIHHAGSDLLRMINDVLDLSRIEAGRLQVVLGPINLAELIEEIAEAMRPQAEEKGVRLMTRIEPDAPRTFDSDRARLQQILRNLLSNALKFTEHGEVEIIARCKPGEPSDPCRLLQLQVRDTGIGIPQDQQERIFQAFQQIDGSISRRFGGAGLGLAITRQLVSVLHGHISVVSAPGEGACFSVELPLEPDGKAAPESPVAPEQQLLVVTGDERCAGLLSEVSQPYGLGTVRYPSVEEADEAIRHRPFKAVVIDLELTSGDGWQLYRNLRNDPRHHDVPVIVLSDSPQAENWHDGALYYLLKPVERSAFQRLCAQLLRQQGSSARLLLIEPDVERARQLRGRAERLGFSVTLTRRSDEARLAFAGQEYRAVVMNLDLPAGEDRDLLVALNRLRPFNKEIKVIVYSQAPVSETELEKLPFPVSVIPTHDSEERIEAILQQNEAQPLPQPDTAGQPLLGRRVLLFDTDVRSIFVLSGLLDGLGLQTTPATQLDEAIARFEESAFDLVLLSVERIEDAAALASSLRDAHGCQVPILCLAGSDFDACRSAGVDDCLSKPVQPEALGSLIQSWLGRAPGSSEA